jgi:NADH-quinone oxidoreductase subunit G
MTTASIHIDGNPYSVTAGQSLLRACLSLGFNVPYFCWHPALESVGACRQCAVKLFRDEKDTRGRIVMSCMTEVTDGMIISLEDPDVRNFRARNIEWLMLNHPHDCPVCDEGGECHLQDMTVMTGHACRRTRFRKRTYRNQDLGPFVNHEMNRCIQCYRCVRFYRDYAHGRDLDVFGAHDSVYFGRHKDGVLENIFSGNLVEICPTGVFTDKTEKGHFVRKWDLATAPSVCVHCGLGCNIIPGERGGKLRRIRNRFNDSVNGYFLCDRGRYGYEFVNSPSRVRQPLARDGRGEHLNPLGSEEARALFADILSRKGRVVGLGSPRASLEANFALRALVGPEHFFAGMAEAEFALVERQIDVVKNGSVPSIPLGEVASCHAVLVLGEDVTNTAPILALNILKACRNEPMTRADALHIPRWEDRAAREAIQRAKGPFFLVTAHDTWLDESAERVFRGAPRDIARLGFAVAHFLDEDSPEVTGMDSDSMDIARTIAESLRQAPDPLIISGPGTGSVHVIDAAANIAWALGKNNRNARLSFTVPECNSLGLVLMASRAVDSALTAVENGDADTMIILENDLFRRTDKDRVTACLNACKNVVLLDHLMQDTASFADLILPAATFAESTGTLVNSEGRAQRFFQVFVPPGDIRPAWQWIRDAMAASGGLRGTLWRHLDDIIGAIAGEFPMLNPVIDSAPPAAFRIEGLKVPRETHRVSGRTSIHANVTVHEPKPPDDPDSPFAFSMEGYGGRPPSSLIPRFWAPRWNSVQALNKFQSEVGGHLAGGDPGCRVIEPDRGKEPEYRQSIPEALVTSGSLVPVPLYHIFGSEELSVLSPSIASRAPGPYVALNPRDAGRLGLSDGDEVEIAGQWRGLVLLRAGLPEGIAGVPSGLPGTGAGMKGGKIELKKVVS